MRSSRVLKAARYLTESLRCAEASTLPQFSTVCFSHSSKVEKLRNVQEPAGFSGRMHQINQQFQQQHTGFSTQAVSPEAESEAEPESVPVSYSVEQQQARAKFDEVLTMPPTGLFKDRGGDSVPAKLDNPIGRAFLSLIGYYSDKSTALVGGHKMYDAITQQSDNPELQKVFGLDPTQFFSSFVLVTVHMWMVFHRLKSWEGADAKYYKQRFYIKYQNDIESRVYDAGVQTGAGSWVKKLENIFYSAGLGFDQVLRGETDAPMTAVIIRDFYGGDESKLPYAELLAKYITREMQCLEMTETKDIVAGNVCYTPEICTAAADVCAADDNASLASPASEVPQ